jgi:WD40 repeat protein
LESFKEISTLSGHTDSVSAIAITSNGSKIISSSWDNSIKVWDLEFGTILVEFYGDGSISSCSYIDAISSIIAEDFGGRIYILRLEGLTSDLPVTTAMEREDGSVRLQCFFCQQWSDLQRVDLGSDVSCPLCGKNMQVNSFTYRENPFN